MGISDYIWPFKKKFSEIPCAREASIAALVGGPCTGALFIIITGRPSVGFKTSVRAGFAIFWLSFIVCRYQQAQYRSYELQFREAMASGKID